MSDSEMKTWILHLNEESEQIKYCIGVLSELWQDSEGAECIAVLKSCEENMADGIKEIVKYVKSNGVLTDDDKETAAFIT